MAQTPQQPPAPPIPPASSAHLPHRDGAGPGAPKPPYNLLAALAPVAAFFCPIIPVGMVLGIVGLQRIRHSGERGRWAAVVGIVINAGWLITMAVMLTVDAVRDDDSSDRAGDVSTRGGDCFVTESFRAPNGFDDISVVPCSRLHVGETYAVFTIDSGAPYPGDPALTPVAERRCTTLIEGFLPSSGSPMTGRDVRFLLPDRARWDAGVRDVACYVLDPGVRLTRPDER